MASKPHIGIDRDKALFRKIHRRKGTTKTRTGCFCCKKRRVKCDETKPNCLRCIQFGIQCDGYPPLPMTNTKVRIVAAVPSTVVKVAYPEIPATGYAASTFAGDYVRPKMLQSPSSVLKFADEAEERYFRTFQTETAAEIAGVYKESFWNGLLLQACLEVPFTQKVVTALAAMSTSKKLSRQVDITPAHRAIIAQQTAFAFKQYHKALKEMRASLQKAGDSRKALIGCVLVVCFESLVGNTASAHANSLSGQKLLERWLVQHPYRKLSEVGIASPASHLIEDDIVQVGFFFDCQILTYLDPRNVEVHRRLRREGDETVAQMPKRFKSLREAHRYGYLFFRRCVHSCREIAELAGDGRLSTTSNYSIIEEGMSALSLASVEDPALATSTIEPMHDFLSQQRQYFLETELFQAAFSDLYEAILMSTNQRDQAAARALMALSFAFNITNTLCLDTDNCSCDHLSQQCQEINSLLKHVIVYRKTQNPNMVFSLDFNINSALFMVARFCRDRLIRREAISLMQMYATSESYHDYRYVIAMCEKVVELEEEGVETDYVPGSARIRFLEETVHPEEQWSTVHYVRGSDNTVRKAEFRW